MAKKVFIIDDDPQVHKMLATVLTPKNFDVSATDQPETALDQLCQNPPDLIVLDIMMPGMSGIELCEQIRKTEQLKDILILMLSAKDSQTDRVKGLQYGANDYVTKPFHVATLVRKIEHMLEK